MNGWVDIVRISDGEVIVSKDLKHITGNITMILPTGRESEIMLGCEQGVFFAHVGTCLGLMEVEMERFEKTLNKYARLGGGLIDGHQHPKGPESS